MPRRTSTGDDAAVVRIATGACRPWNLSTVPTGTPCSPASASAWFTADTCALYAATTSTSSGRSGRPVGASASPGSVHHRPTRSRTRSATTAASAADRTALPPCSTSSPCTPGSTPDSDRRDAAGADRSRSS